MSILSVPIKLWLRGLVGAAINSGIGGATLILVDPTTFNLFHGGAKELGMVMASQAVVGAILWAKTHPVPLVEDSVSVVGR